MKQAYVSIILPSSADKISASSVIELDQRLSQLCRAHEVVLSIPFGSEKEGFLPENLTGPLSIIYTNARASKDEIQVAMLGRVAGDFIIEWHGNPLDLTAEILFLLIEPTNHGIELVEVLDTHQSLLSRNFYALVNLLRSRSAPIHKVVGRAYSRRTLSHVLSAVSFEPQLNILFAEVPVQKSLISFEFTTIKPLKLRTRVREGASLLTKGSKFGSVVPLLLSSVSALFGMSVAVYAVTIYLIEGKTPQGWTTLMIVTGLGQASVLAMLGLIWSRIDYLTRGLSRKVDTTAEVAVIPPSK